MSGVRISLPRPLFLYPYTCPNTARRRESTVTRRCVLTDRSDSLTTQTFHCDTLFDGERLLADQHVSVSEGRIQAIEPASSSADSATRRAALLVPGFVDLQVNGGGGVLFNEAPTVETLSTIAQAHRQGGTVGFLPTLISGSTDQITRAIQAVEDAMAAGVPGVLGIHLEGPWLSRARHGAHDARSLDVPTEAAINLFASLRGGKTLVTLAPEVAGDDVVRALTERGVVVSGGHSEADLDVCLRSLDAGMRGFTHLFNAMPPMLSRDPGMVGAALADDRAWFGIIADGHHVHPASVRAAVRAKPAGGALLVTDAMSTVGAPEAAFSLAGETVSLRDGRLATPEGTLAGAHLTMLDAINNVTDFAAIDWFEAVRMGSTYPAKALSLDGELGSIREGGRASFLILDDSRRLLETVVDGVAYSVTSD